MKQATGDLWTFPTEARVITTNGFVKKNGEGVMGRGVALQATRRFPWIAGALGRHLRARGNHVGWAATVGLWLVFFPVKHDWRERASTGLIGRSAIELVALTNEMGWRHATLPRPGCGNGGLPWEMVERLLTPILDDRFTIVYPGD